MEANTFATSAFISTPLQTAFEYLCSLPNLNEWTLGSRMQEQVDADTWIGTASGYQHRLYYHVRRLQNSRFCGIEWQCGYEYKKYFKSYPVLLFPPEYVEPGSTESGIYFHWVSVIDPVQRTPMIMQGIQMVHNSEARSLKAALERRGGLTEAAQGLHHIETDTIYINAPIEMAAEFLGDLRTMERWSHLLKPTDTIQPEHGNFLDEYGQVVKVTLRTSRLEEYYLVEQDYFHPQHNSMQRSPTFLIPLSYAFGDSTVPGVLLHRITFWKNGVTPRHGKLTIDDFGAENMNIKRLLEAKAGNMATFALGKSYLPFDGFGWGGKTTRMTPPDIFSLEFAQDPYPLYRTMRDEFPLYFHPGANAYILSRYEDIHLALTNPEFTTRSYAAQIEPLLGVTVVQLDGSDHARQRRLLAAPFRADRFHAAFAPAIAEIADRLVDGFVDCNQVELVKEFITPFSVGALATVVGLPQSDLGLFRSWYTALLRFGVNLIGDPEVTRAGFAARDELSAYLRPLVKERREAAGTGLLSMLAHTEVEGQHLSDDEIVHFAMLMIFAGGETVEKTMATFLRNLVAHPEQLAALQADWKLFDQTLAESLRFTAPTHMIPRRTRSEVRVSGGTIPAEAEVICFLASANRDERRFADAERFDIFRTDLDAESAFTTAARHAAFGMGRHFCLGAMMAKIEVEIAVKRLVGATGEVCFADGVPPPDQGLFLRGPAALSLRFAPAAASQGISPDGRN